MLRLIVSMMFGGNLSWIAIASAVGHSHIGSWPAPIPIFWLLIWIILTLVFYKFIEGERLD